MSLVSDWNIGHAEYSGKLGHYKIAASALGQVSSVRLRRLLLANLDRIAYADPVLQSGAIPSANPGVFTPLADVADLRWRWTRHADEANHFADMDQPGLGADAGVTLLDLIHADPANLSIDRWNAFYAGLGRGPPRCPALPDLADVRRDGRRPQEGRCRRIRLHRRADVALRGRCLPAASRVVPPPRPAGPSE